MAHACMVGKESCDVDHMKKQMVLMEVFFQELGLTEEDLSTMPGRPTLGIFHVRYGSLIYDQAYFMGIGEALSKIDPTFRDAKKQAEEIRVDLIKMLPTLKLPNEESGQILY